MCVCMSTFCSEDVLHLVGGDLPSGVVLVVVGSDPALTVLEALRGAVPAPRQEEQSAGGVGEQAGFLLLSAFLCFFPGQMEQRQLCKDEERDVWVPKALAVSRVHQPAEKPGQSPGINQERSDDSLQHPEEATASRGAGPRDSAHCGKHLHSSWRPSQCSWDMSLEENQH